MIIKSITLNNFRQYKGMNVLNFSTDLEKNVTVVIGENTCGKTTLVQSFIWCLYGQADFKDKKILNAEERDELSDSIPGSKRDAFVLVRLTHNETDYIIDRKETSCVGNHKKITVEQRLRIFEVGKNGNAIPLDSEDYENIINDILPQNLSDYFFFWGERIEKLSEKKNLSSAVKQFLGLDTMDCAIRHLSMAVNKLTKEPGTNNTSDTDILQHQHKINKKEKENKNYEIQINSNKSKIDYYQEKANQLYAELTTSENQELQSRQNEFIQKSKQLEICKTDLEKAKKNFSSHFNDPKNYVYFFASSLEKRAIDVLKNNPEPVIGWKYIDLNAINEVLKKGKCICGNEFCNGDLTYQYLIEQRKLVAPNIVGGVINSFIEESERRVAFNKNYYELIHEDYKKINELNDRIVDLEYEVSQLKKLITGKSDMKEKHKRYLEARGKVEDAKAELAKLQVLIENNNKEIERHQNNIQILMNRNKRYIKQARTITYANKVLEVFKSDYASNENNLKAKLEEYVNKNFDEVYSGNRSIQIDDKYNAVAFNKVGNRWITSETSPGLETVKNFAFIAGLVQCAKEKIIGGDGCSEEANANSYPLVLDAPFSQADENHVPAISKLISNNAEQIILVVMKKDWNYATNVLNEKVGKFYHLEKQTETHTVVREGE